MRLTIINQFYAPDISPTAQLSASLAEHRAALGDEVTVVSSSGGYVRVSKGESRISNGQGQSATQSSIRNSKFEIPNRPRVCRLWTPRLGKGSKLRRVIDYGCFYAAAAVRMLTLRRQDVVISLTTPPFIAWTGVLHKLVHRRNSGHPGCKLILWNMDCYPEVAERSGVIREGGLLSRILRAANRALFRRVDRLVCLDTAMVELLTGTYGEGAFRMSTLEGRMGDGGDPQRPIRHPESEIRNRKEVTIIPNWERCDLFPADAAPPRWEGLDDPALKDRFIVLYLGNMGQGHTFDAAVAAAKRLEPDGVAFLFVGGGSRRGEIEAEARRIGAANVVLRAYVDKSLTPGVMAAAGAALITLRDEALGVMSPSKLHANLAMGLPIAYVGPPKSNVDDAIVRFGCGVSVRDGEVDALVAFIRRLRADAAEHARLRAAARAAFEAAYCDAVTLPRFDAILAATANAP